MRSRRALYNTVASAISQLSTFMVGITIPRLIIAHYGSSLNGLQASVSQLLGYLSIIEMGLGGSLIFSLYKPLADGDVPRINAILSAAKRSYQRTGLYFAVLVAVLALVYPHFVSINHVDAWSVTEMVLAIGGGGVMDYFIAAKFKVLLVAAQKGYVIAVARIVYSLFNALVMIVLIRNGIALWNVYEISIISNIIPIFVVTWYTRRKHPYIDLSVGPDLTAMSKRYDVILHQVSGMIVSGSPVVLLTLFRPLSDVSIYSVYAMVFMGVTMIVGVFNNGLTAGFGQIIAQRRQKALENAYSEYELLYYMILTFVYSCTVILGMSFMEIYTKNMSDANYIRPTMFILFIVAGILDNWKIPQSTIIISSGHFRETRHRAIIEAVLTIVAVTASIRIFGLVGALLGSIVGLGYRGIDLFYPKRIANIPVKTTLLRLSRIPVAGLVVIIPFHTVISINPTNFVTWVETSLGVCTWSAFVVLVINLIFEKGKTLQLFHRIISLIKSTQLNRPA